MDKYFEINRDFWNIRTEVHIQSAFYDMEAFRNGKNSLQTIELELLGDLSGKELLHLQCHFGQDTLSMARLGAKVTGVDLSDTAIKKAKEIANELALEADFYCGNVLELDQVLAKEKKYDLIFSSYGVLGWLPELNTWAKHIQHFLKPGGKFILVEFHPVVWMFDDLFNEIAYSYFNLQPYFEEIEGSYADANAPIKANSCYWNHSTSELLDALIRNAGLRLSQFLEFDYSPYNCFQKTVPCENGYQIEGLEGKLPMVFAVVCEKL